MCNKSRNYNFNPFEIFNGLKTLGNTRVNPRTGLHVPSDTYIQSAVTLIKKLKYEGNLAEIDTPINTLNYQYGISGIDSLSVILSLMEYSKIMICEAKKCQNKWKPKRDAEKPTKLHF